MNIQTNALDEVRLNYDFFSYENKNMNKIKKK